MLACKKRLINMRTVWYNADDKRINLETHPLKLASAKFIPANSQFSRFPRQKTGFTDKEKCFHQQSDINVEQTLLQRTKHISKCVKKAKLLNTRSFCDI